MSETQIISGRSIPLTGAATRTCKRALFLASRSAEPCGVETFTRTLVAALAARDHVAGQDGGQDAGYELVAVSGRWRDVPALLQRIGQADRIVFGFPLVAWKRLLVIPLVLLLFGWATRRRISTFAHEWAGMNWLRRLVLAPYLLLSRSILVLSPLIRAQIAADPVLARAARKCRLVPHPPTVRRPERRPLTGVAATGTIDPGALAAGAPATGRVVAVERAARDADVVIGHFGAIYQGKAAMALLEICDHLRGRGTRALLVFVGSFTNSLDGYEKKFRDRLRALALEDQVIVTGYVADTDELFALFERIGVFAFLFAEGLTARRSSVITCLQSNRPVVVTAPQSLDEFRHHPGLTQLIEGGALSFVPRTAAAAEIADRLLAAAAQHPKGLPAIDADAWWATTTEATRAAL
jgi:glycosyltransferase involved in cell wall biosynthesis